MSKLNDLIAELCPHGVEFKTVGEVIKKYSIKAKHDKSVKLVYAISKDFGIIPSLEYWQKTASEKRSSYQIYSEDTSNYSIIRKNMFAYNPARLNIGSINCLFDKMDGLLSPMYTIFSINEKLFLPKFFLYFLQTSRTVFQINNFTEEGARFRFDFLNWNKIKIPVPPLPVQAEIVRILDTFTELTAELTARKQQYEYYRDLFLTFDNVEYKKLGEIAEIGTGNSNTNEGFSQGLYPFFVRSGTPLYKNEFEYDETAIITAGDGVGVGKVFHYIEGKYALHQRAYRIHIISHEVISKYFYHYMRTNFLKYIEKNMYQGSVASIRRPMLNNFLIPLPPLAEQERIVEILDRFDKLCNDISEGIPAEIAARQKQYEYYRDKLLTFEEADKNE